MVCIVRVGDCLVCQPVFFRLQKGIKIRLMERVAFKMKINIGCADVYKKRHDALWPELEMLLKTAGIKEYSIFLDDTSNDLFGYLKIEDAKLLDSLKEQEVFPPP